MAEWGKSQDFIQYQKEMEEKRRKYIEYRTVGRMNKKDAALAAGFSFAMATRPGMRIETPEVIQAIERYERAQRYEPGNANAKVDVKALTQEELEERKRWLEEQLGIKDGGSERVQ